MIKRDEVRITDSCFNRAEDDEPVFVLLGRDPAAPEAIRQWAAERVRLGLNSLTDAKIVLAFDAAGSMKAWDVKRRAGKSALNPEAAWPFPKPGARS